CFVAKLAEDLRPKKLNNSFKSQTTVARWGQHRSAMLR
ncbi:hypothetical protein PENNAL_c0433G06803, partial [Penicillium nalgiovense]